MNSHGEIGVIKKWIEHACNSTRICFTRWLFIPNIAFASSADAEADYGSFNVQLTPSPECPAASADDPLQRFFTSAKELLSVHSPGLREAVPCGGAGDAPAVTEPEIARAKLSYFAALRILKRSPVISDTTSSALDLIEDARYNEEGDLVYTPGVIESNVLAELITEESLRTKQGCENVCCILSSISNVRCTNNYTIV